VVHERNNCGPTRSLEAHRGACELTVRERKRARRGGEQREAPRQPHRRRLLPRRSRPRERRVYGLVLVLAERASVQPEERQHGEQDDEREIEGDDPRDRVQQLERSVLAEATCDREHGDDSNDVERPDERPTGNQPRESEQERPADEPERCDTDDQEPDEAVDAGARARDADDEFRPLVHDQVSLFVRSGNGCREVRQCRHVSHRDRGCVRECVERVLERREIGQWPGEQEERKRKRERNERSRAEEEDDRSRREQRERQEIEPHRPEVLRPQHRACADDQQRGQEEDPCEQEVESTQPKRRHVTMAQARPEEQGRR
jgi:hypothetical protein